MAIFANFKNKKKICMIGRILCHDSLLKPITEGHMVGETGKRRPKL